MKRLTLMSLLAFLTMVSMALADVSAVGKWKTIDDKTKKEKSIIELYESNGKLYGRIIQLLQEKDVGKVCSKCSGSDKEKPIVGMVIVKDLKKEGSIYKGGTIMDPNDGKIYDCKIEVTADANQLNVRGFYGISILGRTQVWYRVK
ncbi:MAG: DUF2147 domain-containing protein [Syntrophales bacterium]|nr:DUF2147 domain-containing protein [Syntrophales bacterium]